MEDQILDGNLGSVPQSKLYKARSLSIAALFGGPLAGGYMLAENFNALGENSKSGKTWVYTVLIMIAFLVILLILPRRIAAPIEVMQVVPFISIGVCYLIFTNLQGTQINRHSNTGGEFYSGWRALLIGIICLFITLIAIIGAYFMADLLNFPRTYEE